MAQKIDEGDCHESAQATLHAQCQIEKQIAELRNLFDQLGIYEKICNKYSSDDPLATLAAFAKSALYE